MIEKISVSLTDQIIESRLASKQMREWYIYAFQRLFETSISIITMLFIGVVIGNVISMALFWLFFDLLRRRAGGFHCKKYWQCYIFTTVVFVGVAVIEPVISRHPIMLIILLSVTALEILIIGTVNHPAINYDSVEMERSKRLSRRTLAIELWIIISFWEIGIKESYLTCMSMGVVLCGVLMVLAILFKQEVKVNEDKR